MQRLKAIDPENATGEAKRLLERIQERYGMTTNFEKTLANSPAVLEGYLNFREQLELGLLDAKLRERIALLVSEKNCSPYCLALHTVLGRTAGLSEEEILDSRRAVSSDRKVEIALLFVCAVLAKYGQVSDTDVVRLRQGGYGDGEISEIIADIGLMTFSNYFSQVAGTALDLSLVSDSPDFAGS
jgi:AhpD family alkylhydroperoxidase